MNGIADLLLHMPDWQLMTQVEQVRYIIYGLGLERSHAPVRRQELLQAFIDNKLPAPSNLNRELKKLLASKVIRESKDGVYLYQHQIDSINIEFGKGKIKAIVSNQLRDLVPVMNAAEQSDFLLEAINDFEVGSYRSAVIMTWLLTLDILREYVLANKLVEFNSELKSRGINIRPITSKDDFDEMKESMFVDLIKFCGVVSKDQHKILAQKLDIRNTASHPNKIKIKEAQASAYIDDLVTNILDVFQ